MKIIGRIARAAVAGAALTVAVAAPSYAATSHTTASAKPTSAAIPLVVQSCASHGAVVCIYASASSPRPRDILGYELQLGSQLRKQQWRMPTRPNCRLGQPRRVE